MLIRTRRNGSLSESMCPVIKTKIVASVPGEQAIKITAVNIATSQGVSGVPSMPKVTMYT